MPTRATLNPGRRVHRPRSRRTKLAALGALALLGAAVLPPGISGAASDPGLGAAGDFAVLGAGTVTNTGLTVVNGDLGVHPGNAVTGFAVSDGGPGIVNGTVHGGDGAAASGQADAAIAYDALAAQPCDEDRTGQDLGGLTLTPGVYCFSSSAQLTGVLTLDAVGDPDAVFIFRVGTALTTASNSSVEFTNDLASCNVHWQVGSAATLGTDTDFVGTVIALTEAITANTGARVLGRLLALNAAVTLDSNVITASSCAPVEDTPVEDTPVDDTPVEDTPVDDTPVDDTPVDESNQESSDGVPILSEGPGAGPSGPGSTTGGPVPAGPGPELPVTGSNLVLGGYGALAILVGASLVLMGKSKRMRVACPSSPGRSRSSLTDWDGTAAAAR